ncbi:TPA: succinylglutamate desuccinylase/aspartoacylase family protein [Burkholderia aenigmatica]|uniref:succinylglutamate desuccinylase/aspartoacylase family protein n=1 Tax=Burkholderia sp. AU45251 TaxID=3059204 RepID=UPI002655D9A8|nr:succinylglutamate desuccinylase/aspartoacylase family protein [Burkholderia sp. AU45251]HDR9483982.1 succinylglutamate desuccinylase/aspartoacylase family protein [Burkholderia aenigmatica]MDN7516242.1 succinylglutamate desuccinylase/aspartoacylase family protein [Burkholderia sp. AU45251]HDR9514947.1 succinylglutamate desuccinylase/aspartoacylase family protein [Burkholderia aenigmatica]HDR9592032.1 succinylglutamate desuccinylase/aspartoacylase family protein [Burkholderia aenigmatica]HDR
MTRLNIDWQLDGRQAAYLELPSSTNTSAWQNLRIPVFFFRNGVGPSTLLLGGSHGDEYEGQIALSKLAHALDARALAGSVIIIPSLNLPAVLDGARLSPLDNCNLNREFPGNDRGSVTQRLAHFISYELVPRVDHVVDLHSGGRTLRFHPCMFVHEQSDASRTAAFIDAARSFDAPFTVVLREDHADVMIDDVVERAGKLMLASELGGSALVTPSTIKLTHDGLHRLLRHLGHFRRADCRTPAPASRVLHVPGSEYTVLADDTALFEPMVELGATVRQGDVLGVQHYMDRTTPPAPVHAPREGVLLCLNGQALVRRDDTVAVIAVPFTADTPGN